MLKLNKLYEKQISKVDEDKNVKKINVSILRRWQFNGCLFYIFFSENVKYWTKEIKNSMIKE